MPTDTEAVHLLERYDVAQRYQKMRHMIIVL